MPIFIGRISRLAIGLHRSTRHKRNSGENRFRKNALWGKGRRKPASGREIVAKGARRVRASLAWPQAPVGDQRKSCLDITGLQEEILFSNSARTLRMSKTLVAG